MDERTTRGAQQGYSSKELPRVPQSRQTPGPLQPRAQTSPPRGQTANLRRDSEQRHELDSGFSSQDTSRVELGTRPSPSRNDPEKGVVDETQDADGAPIEIRHTHDYVIRRPRPTLVEHQGHVLAVKENGNLDTERPENNYHLDIHNHPQHHGHRSASLIKQRERLDIFVDLIWVGIIGNIAEHFHQQVFVNHRSPGFAVGEFILLFIPAWRIWILLQTFLNSYFTDDFLQRFFVVWIMILGLIWGNNAPYLLDRLDEGDNWTIVSYLVALTSFSLLLVLYSIWLPWLRRYNVLLWIVLIPSVALWIGATTIAPGHTKTALVATAICVNIVELFFLSTPLARRFLISKGINPAPDFHAMIRRYENFFVIALGEGVFLLIRNSPLADPTHGFLTPHLSRGIVVLLIYYFLNWIYFHGDMSKRYVHAMDRNWWCRFAWGLLHIPLFSALVILSSSTLFLVGFPLAGEGADYSTAAEPATTAETPAPEHRRRAAEAAGAATEQFDETTLRIAATVACVSVSVVLASQLVIALLNRPADRAGSHGAPKVSSRWVRMVPRAAGVVVLATVWLSPTLVQPDTVLGVVLAVVAAVAGLEQLLGMARGARFLEPKEEAVSV